MILYYLYVKKMPFVKDKISSHKSDPLKYEEVAVTKEEFKKIHKKKALNRMKWQETSLRVKALDYGEGANDCFYTGAVIALFKASKEKSGRYKSERAVTILENGGSASGFWRMKLNQIPHENKDATLGVIFEEYMKRKIKELRLGDNHNSQEDASQNESGNEEGKEEKVIIKKLKRKPRSNKREEEPQSTEEKTNGEEEKKPKKKETNNKKRKIISEEEHKESELEKEKTIEEEQVEEGDNVADKGEGEGEEDESFINFFNLK